MDQSCNINKDGFHYKCLTMNFKQFFKILFLQNTSMRLLVFFIVFVELELPFDNYSTLFINIKEINEMNIKRRSETI